MGEERERCGRDQNKASTVPIPVQNLECRIADPEPWFSWTSMSTHCEYQDRHKRVSSTSDFGEQLSLYYVPDHSPFYFNFYGRCFCEEERCLGKEGLLPTMSGFELGCIRPSVRPSLCASVTVSSTPLFPPCWMAKSSEGKKGEEREALCKAHLVDLGKSE